MEAELSAQHFDIGSVGEGAKAELVGVAALGSAAAKRGEKNKKGKRNKSCEGEGMVAPESSCEDVVEEARGERVGSEDQRMTISGVTVRPSFAGPSVRPRRS